MPIAERRKRGKLDHPTAASRSSPQVLHVIDHDDATTFPVGRACKALAACRLFDGRGPDRRRRLFLKVPGPTMPLCRTAQRDCGVAIGQSGLRWTAENCRYSRQPGPDAASALASGVEQMAPTDACTLRRFGLDNREAVDFVYQPTVGVGKISRMAATSGDESMPLGL